MSLAAGGPEVIGGWRVGVHCTCGFDFYGDCKSTRTAKCTDNSVIVARMMQLFAGLLSLNNSGHCSRLRRGNNRAGVRCFASTCTVGHIFASVSAPVLIIVECDRVLVVFRRGVACCTLCFVGIVNKACCDVTALQVG